MSVSPTIETVYVGNTVQLTGTVNSSNTTESTLWTSSNTKVWAIDKYYNFPYEVTTLKIGNIVVACTKLLKHTHNDDEYYGTDGGKTYVLNRKGQKISSLGENYNGYGYRYVASSKDGGFYFCNWYDPNPEYSLQQKGSIAVYKSSCSGEIEWS